MSIVWWIIYLIIFFFFQAEDGIRDLTVTGVQTCALPICRPQPRQRLRLDEAAPGGLRQRPHARQADARRRCAHRPVRTRRGRSEERRVGKEWRTRRSP